MVVRLVGNQADYQKMLKDVERQTEQTAQWAEARGSRIAAAFNKAFKAAAMSTAIGGSINAPLAKAAGDFSSYGKAIQEVVRDSEKAAQQAERMQKILMANTAAYKDLAKVTRVNNQEAAVYLMMSQRTGKSIEELIKYIRVGTVEFEKWNKEAKKFGLILKDEDVKAANDLAESWIRVKQAMQGFWSQLGAIVGPRFKEFNDMVVGLIQSATRWVDRNRDLIKSLQQVGERLIYVGTIVTAVLTGLGTLATMIVPLTASITAGALAWKYYSEEVKRAYDIVMDYGKRIIGFMDDTVKGIKNALKASDVELAVKILWSSIKVAWMHGMQELDKLTGEKFSAIFDNLSSGNWKSALESVAKEIELLWLKMLDKMDPIFTDIVNRVAQFWAEIVNTFEESIQSLFSVIQDFAAYDSGVAFGLGKTELGKSLLKFSTAAPLSTQASRDKRTADALVEADKRADASYARRAKYAEEIARLEAEIAEAKEKANAQAQLSLGMAGLERDLRRSQASAEAEKVEAERDKAKKDLEKLEKDKKELEDTIRRESSRQSIEEKHDPVARYIRQLRELNEMFLDSERGMSAYKKELKSLQDELADSSFRVNVEFTATGMDAVRMGTREYQQIIANTLESLERKKVKERALAEAKRREAEDAKARDQAPKPAPGALAAGDPAIPRLDRIATAVEKMADRPTIQFEPVGLV
jgi:hypothetical protein